MIERKAKYVEISKSWKEECDAVIGQPNDTTTHTTVKLHDTCFNNKGTIAHELIHAIGAVHEQVRFDRNLFLDIDCKNIEQAAYKQYTRKIRFSETEGTVFDFYSIMMYRKHELKESAKNKDRYVMKAKDFYRKRFMKDGKGILDVDVNDLSAGDVVEMSKNYKCPVRPEILEEYLRYTRDITTALVDNIEECLEKSNNDCLIGMSVAEDYLDEWKNQRAKAQIDTTAVEYDTVYNRWRELDEKYAADITSLKANKKMVSANQLELNKPICP